MNPRQRRRTRKWLILGVAGMAAGTAMLYFFRSIPVASGTAAATIIAMIVLKHVALFVAVSSPMAALLQSLKPKLREICGRAPEDEN